MVVKKSEAGFLTGDQRKEVETLEKLIDQALREKYIPGSMVTVSLDNLPSPRARMQLVSMYKEVGWTLTFRSDEQGGCWTEFT